MQLSGPLKWWDEWQLRILVLSSLAAQGILFFAAYIRQVHALRRLRAVVWIAYIGGDAIAIYALATLFNRHNEPSPDGVLMSSSLEIIWAPVLLIHLGGQPSISAFSLEDNELWKRHVITLVCQVTVALYVFCKWWSGDERQLKAAVLLFIVGIIKFARRPWALWCASFNSLRAFADVAPKKSTSSWWRSCTAYLLNLLSEVLEENEREEETDISLQEYVEKARNCMKEVNILELRGIDLLDDMYKMFVDMSVPYHIRIQDLQSFLLLDNWAAHAVCGGFRNLVFQYLYTDLRSSLSGIAYCAHFVLPCLLIASLVIFAKSDKDGYQKADIRVTYILFSASVAQEFLPWFLTRFVEFIVCHCRLTSSHDMVSQWNLMSFSIRKKNPTILMKLAPFKCLGVYINKRCNIHQVAEARKITGLLNKHLRDGWNGYIVDVSGYKRFNNFRGQRTLRRHHQLQWVLNVQFDRSVLLWHIATDLCFHHQINMTPGRQRRAAKSRVISNYMAYLFSEHPEMLMPGTRRGLLDIASRELELIMKNFRGAVDSEEMLVQDVIVGTPVHAQGMAPTIEQAESPTSSSEGDQFRFSLVMDACQIAKLLMELGEQRMWRVIQGVWVEMLCYSASRCRGYLHATSLGQGGEYLTTVWLLWSFMGMETLTYMIQSPEITQEEEEEEEEEELQEEDNDEPTQSNNGAC